MSEINNIYLLPNHISNDATRDGLIGKGILSQKELIGLETEISARLFHPTTIYEFYENKLKRSDSILQEAGLSKPCQIFREASSVKLCNRADEMMARLFKGLKRDQIENDLNQKLLDYSGDEWLPQKGDISVSKINYRYFIQYDCNYLGYRELIFPIYYKRKDVYLNDPTDYVIACFIIGQICIEGRKKNIENIRASFFNKIRTYYQEKNRKCLLSQTEIEEIIKSEKRISLRNRDLWKNIIDKHRVEKETDFIDLIKDIDKELSEFEILLNNRYRREVEYNSLQKIETITKKLYEEIPEIEIKNLDENPLVALWENIGKRMLEIVSYFNFRYIGVFAVDNPIDDNDEKIDLALYVNNNSKPREYKRPIGECKYSMKYLPKNNFSAVITSREYPEILAGLPNNWPYKESTKSTSILAYKIPYQRKRPIIVVIGHSNGEGPLDEIYVQNALWSFGNAIGSIISGMLERIAERKTTLSYRVLRHEMEPQTIGLKHLVETYLAYPDDLVKLDTKKIKDIYSDLNDFIDHINYLYSNAKSLLTHILENESFNLNKEYFYVYGPLFYRFKDLFRKYLRDRNMEIPLKPAEYNDELPKILADKKFLELIIFNMITNAYKYGHHGTNIQLDYRVEKEKYIITITNYGINIPNTEIIFKLFVRGHETLGTEGAGIGLTLSKKIAIAHGGDINCKSKKICEYNVSIMRQYIKYVNDGKIIIDKNKRENIESVYYELGDIMIKKICSKIYEPSSDECIREINIPTYENIFEISISKK